MSAVAPAGRLDDKARARVVEHLDANLIVEAAAGTGKTTALVARIVAMVESGRATLDQVAALTFTVPAAGEMKLRLRAELERRASARPAGSAERAHLERALGQLEEAWVGTIHAFCAEILRARALEARVDPEYAVLTEPEARRAWAQAFQSWLEEQLHDPPEGVRRSLRRRAGRDDDPVARLRDAGWELAQWRDFAAPWTRPAWDRARAIDAAVERLHAFARLSEAPATEKDGLFQDTEPARQASREIRAAEEVRARDLDGVEALLAALPWARSGGSKFRAPRSGFGKAYAPNVARADVQAAHAALVETLETFARDADADLCAELAAELRGAVRGYQDLKRRRGELDFVDLLLLARDLVRDDATVRADLQRRFTRIFVDEFQDTDPLQAEIVMLLAADDPREREWTQVKPAPGRLFLVGDPKQSIYRFRRADVGAYATVCGLLERAGAERVVLETSFRAVPAIQHAVNAAFAPVLDGDAATHQAAYVPLGPARGAIAGQPAVVVLPVPEPYGARGVTNRAIEQSLPNAVGAFVAWLVQKSGWQVTEGDGAEVPVQARHVCLLFRKLEDWWSGDVSRPYVAALEARGIRHLLVGGKAFHDREEVAAMRTALAAIEWPEDELSVFATLKGPLFAIADEDLLEHRHRFGRLDPFHPPADPPPHLEPIAAALRALADLHLERHERPIAETVRALLEETRAHAGFAFHPAGEHVLANVLHLTEQARAFERGGGLSFRGFVERLAEEAETRASGEAPILEKDSDGVRVMTVHKAKGLEFPVVILADPTAGIAVRNASRTLDPARGLCALRLGPWSPRDLIDAQEVERRRDVAEGVRVAYVAATRARDLLVVPAIGDGPYQPWRAGDPPGWLSPLDRAIYPPEPAWRASRPAPGCPPFGDDATLSRPDPSAPPAGVKPGLHVVDGREVVWWDPRALTLEAPPPAGIRKDELIAKDVDPGLVAADRAAYEEWSAERERLLATASTPGLRVATVTARASDPAAAALDVDPVEMAVVPRVEDRPSGPRFGALVHAVLGTVPLDAGADAIAATVRLQARILGATPEETEAATQVVAATLAHPLLARARPADAAGRCRREAPLTLLDDDGTIVEGQADLVFFEGGAWVVVDFKTDRELARDPLAYRRQVALYARAVAAATGAAARGVLVSV